MEWSEFFAAYGAALVWLLIAIVAAIIEGLTCDLVSIWFVPGALAAMLLSFFVDLIGLQIAVFLILSILSLVLAKTVFRKYLPQARPQKLNADALIGEHAVVQEEINNLYETGSVKINGLVWSARSAAEGETIPSGAIVTVCEIKGVKLICKLSEKSE